MAEPSDSTATAGATPNVDNGETPRPALAQASRTQVGSTVMEGFDLHLASYPTRLGKYIISERLGFGGMGVVFKAVDPDLNRVVAVKTIRAGLFADEDQVQRFYNEARAIAHFRHPNIVQIYEIDRDAGQHYFTMEFAAGGALSRRHAEVRARGPKASAELIEKIARAVHFAHEQKLVHRDLKPGNILLDDKGEPLVSDFGLVKYVEGDTSLTGSGQAVGTLPYMSPEQVAGEKDKIGIGSDIWAIGVMLFELLAGQRPFCGKSKEETSSAIRERPMPSLRKINPSLDRDLETIVGRCLEKHADERYKSALELAEDLQAWREGRPIRARPWPAHVRIWRLMRRRPLAATALSLMFTLVIGTAIAVALFLLRDPDAWEKDVQGNLEAGQPVTLIGNTGGPAGHRWPIKADPRTHAAVTPDQLFGAHAEGVALVELLGEPGISSFRFEAEIKHETDQIDRCVGLYLGHQRHAAPAGEVHVLLAIQFNSTQDARARHKDLLKRIGQPPPEGNRFDVEPLLIFEGKHPINIPVSPRYHFIHEGGPKWRRLVVEATTAGLQVTFDDFVVGKWRWQEFHDMCDKHMALMHANPNLGPRVRGVVPRVSARGGLGLYLNDSSALFRNVKITPIPDR